MSSQQAGPASAGAGAEASPAKSMGGPAKTTPKPVGPPPESKENIWLRRAAIASFWAVVLFLGLPMWLKTTAVYRAALPLQQMSDWAEGQVCKPIFPLRIAVEAQMPDSTAHNLIQLTQHTLDNLNEFPAHSLRLLRSESPYNKNASQQVITSDGQSIRSDDEDVALVVRLISVETGETPRSQLQPYTPTLDVYYSPDQLPTGGRTDSPLAGYIANELHNVFEEEQAHLSYLLSTLPSTDTSKLKPFTHEIYADHQRQSTKALKYAPTYHLTFSLFSPFAAPASWEIQSALKTYLTPLLETLSGITNFTVDSQVQLYATMSPSIRQPEYDEERKAWTLRKEDLSGFINAAEWPLSPSIGEGPTVNFILYVPDASQTPLIIKENAGNSWLIPQWGGVHILNLPAGQTTPSALSAVALEPAMQTFSNQFITLFGLPQAPASLPLRILTLERSRAASLIASTSSTLGALAQVYQKLPSIPVPDKVAQSVDISISRLKQACGELHNGRFRRALDQARIAQVEAEKAFFEKSMVGQVYFPDEHKVAVYLPLLGPVAVPLIMAGFKELQLALKRR